MLPRTAAPRRRGVPVDGETRRFSPLTAPQRAAVEAFCDQSRPWALRQAARAYGHLPEELREQAVDQAMQELRTSAPAALNRRTLQSGLAAELTEALRRVHVGWCLNQSSALWREEGAPPPAPPGTPAPERLTGFVEEGLGGLERAVLQLEIGAGRDSRTVRAALRLGPRQYARHREQGLSKLRDAITGQVAGQVCDHHLHAVVLAATGDRAAADGLAAGAERCRSCSREAQGLRRLLHERLALAPWPLAIKPVGLLGAKFGALGTASGLKGGAGAGAGAATGFVPSATAVTALVAAAALATGGAAALSRDDAPAERPVAAALQASAPFAATISEEAPERSTPAKRSATRKARAGKRRRAAAWRERAAERARAPRPVKPTQAAAPAPAAATPAPAATSAPVAQAPSPVAPVRETVDDTVQTVRDTVGRVTKPIAPTVAQPVDDALDSVQGTVDEVTGTLDPAQGAVDQVTGTVDGLLGP